MVAIVRFKAEEDWIEAAVDAALGAVSEARTRGLRPTLCLAGGSTPEPVYAALARRLAALALPAPIRLVVGDERLAPRSESERNATMIRRAFAPALASNAVELLAWRVELEAQACLAAMEKELAALLAERAAAGEGSPFDLALLGLGSDGHTAGIFSAAAGEPPHGPFVAATEAPTPPRARASLSLSFLAQSRATLYLVRAEGKAEAIARLEAADPACPAVVAASRHGPSSAFIVEVEALRVY